MFVLASFILRAVIRFVRHTLVATVIRKSSDLANQRAPLRTTSQFYCASGVGGGISVLLWTPRPFRDGQNGRAASFSVRARAPLLAPFARVYDVSVSSAREKKKKGVIIYKYDVIDIRR